MNDLYAQHHPVGATVRLKPYDKMPQQWQVDPDHDDYDMYQEIYNEYAGKIFTVEIIRDWRNIDVPACIRRDAAGRQLGWTDAWIDEWDLVLVFEDVNVGVF